MFLNKEMVGVHDAVEKVMQKVNNINKEHDVLTQPSRINVNIKRSKSDIRETTVEATTIVRVLAVAAVPV